MSRFTITIEHKSVATEYKADVPKRQVTGYASVFSNVDGNGDVVLKGAYARTLEQDLPTGRIKVKRNHETLIGKPVHAEEDSKGLLTVSQIAKTALGDETLALIQDGVIDRMSIGFRTDQKSYTTVDGQKVRNLEAVTLREWSFLDDPPANDEAIITGVKSLDDSGDPYSRMQRALDALATLCDNGDNGAEQELSRLLTAFRTTLGR